MSDVFATDSDEARVYGDLMRQPHSYATDIAKRIRMSAARVRTALEYLSGQRLVVNLPTDGEPKWEAQPPESAGILAAEERRLAALREQVNRLTDAYWFARRETRDYPGIEILRDRAMVYEQSSRILADAEHEVRWFDCPPYHLDYFGTDDEPNRQLDLQRERIAAGVRHRTIYRDDIFSDPVHGPRALRSVADGEQARTLPTVPMNLLIGDHRQALVPLDPPDLVDGATLVVKPSGLLSALVSVFEALWSLAVPVSTVSSRDGLGEADREMLVLMAAGATDEVIGRRLNVSRRTVVRRTAALLERLGATSRFQAGIQAVRLGWL